MDTAANRHPQHRPGPPAAPRIHRREQSTLREWRALDALATLDEVESTLRDATHELRRIRCLIDRLGAIPLGAND